VPVLLTKHERPEAIGSANGNGTVWPAKKLGLEGAIGDRYCVCVIVRPIVFMNDVVGPGDRQRARNEVPLLGLVYRVSKNHDKLRGQDTLWHQGGNINGKTK